MKLPPLVSAPVSPPPGNTDATAKIQQVITSQPLTPAEGVSVQLGQVNNPPPRVVFEPPVIIRASSISNSEHQTRTSERLQQQLDDFSFSLRGTNRFNGAGERFGELLRDGETPYHQEMRRYQYYTDKTRANQPVDFSEFSISEERRTQNFDLSLTTRSGAKVSFQLQSFSGVGKNPDTVLFQSDEMTLSKAGQFASFNRTEVRFNIEGELTDDEQQQLQKFSEQLEAFAGGYFNQGKPSLKDLNLSQFDSISKLSVTGNGGGQADLKLEYHNSEDSRDIRFRFDGNKAEFKLDKTNPLSYQQPGKQQAIEHYLDLLDRSAKKAKADDMQQNMMKDVLAAGFEFSQAELNLAQQQQQQQQQQQDNTFNSDGLKQNHLFVPLPDFDFRFSSRKDQLPTDVISLQERGFDLSLSLKTQKRQDNGKVSIQQKQSFELSGSYTEQPDKDGLNFRRTSFDIKSSNIIYTESKQGELLSAMVEKQQSQRETVEDFNFDTLVNTEKEESEFISADELPDSVTHTPLQQWQQLQQQQQWLDQLLLNPFA
ncbi:hypothetical protein [Bacterioplanoides pacificum]|uniref:Uncharacterized protein n=1 Tax=Bacterioplanoides pacificum TaxID=1171596 RepID=A0ABV7VX57_9GAMM